MSSGAVMPVVIAVILIATSSFILFSGHMQEERKQQIRLSRKESKQLMPDNNISPVNMTAASKETTASTANRMRDALLGKYVPPRSTLNLWIFKLQLVWVVLVTFVLGNLLAVMRQSTALEFHKASHDREVLLMWELSDLTSRIASSNQSAASNDLDNQRFWEITMGSGQLIRDRQVHLAMDKFAECVRHPGRLTPDKDCNTDEMQRRSLILIQLGEVFVSHTPTYH